MSVFPGKSKSVLAKGCSVSSAEGKWKRRKDTRTKVNISRRMKYKHRQRVKTDIKVKRLKRKLTIKNT